MATKPSYYIDVPNDVATPDGGLNYAVNGRLDPALLRQVRGGGMAHHTAAPRFEAMKLAFDTDPTMAGRGYQLSYTGIYRTYTRQVQLLYERTYQVASCAQCSRRCYRWNGTTRCLKAGAAGVATPGTSNHGWGLAFDLAIRLETGGLISITPGVPWLERHAGWFGFFNETGRPGSSGYENWHYTSIYGDVPAPFQRTQPPPPPPTGDDDDMALWARFEADTTQPVDIAFTAVGWRRLTPAQVAEMRYVGVLRDNPATPGLPAILPGAWETAYPEVNKP